MTTTCPWCRRQVPVDAGGRLAEHTTRPDPSAPMCVGGGREAAK